MVTESIPPTETGPALPGLLARAREVAIATGQGALAERFADAAERLGRQVVTLAVSGEFKKGKSSLINGLLGEQLAPVGDDIATTTLALYSDAPERRAVAHIRTADGIREVEIPLESATQVGGFSAGPGERVEFFHVSAPNPFLANGIVLVDSPGMGGIEPGLSALTLSALERADAVLFVTDASAPLAASELQFYRRAASLTTPVALVVTKTDLYAEWRRVVELNRITLAEEQLELPQAPVSNTLRATALETRDAGLNTESGYPALLALIQQDVLERAKANAAIRARADLAAGTAALAAYLATAVATLEGASDGKDALAEARARLDRARAVGNRWTVVLGDGFADLASEVDHEFRSALRNRSRAVEDELETIDPKDHWDDVSTRLREEVATATTASFARISAGTQEIYEAVAGSLREELGAGPGDALTGAFLDVEQLWRTKATPDHTGMRAVAETSFTGLRGAQSGILVFGMLASLMGITLSGVATFGVGALFGGKQLLEDRNRKIAARRQQARAAARTFVDDVQFEASKGIRDLLRDRQRELRDFFAARLGGIVAASSQAVESLQASATQDQSGRATALASLRRNQQALTSLMAEAASE